jgi:cysteine desulfurase
MSTQERIYLDYAAATPLDERVAAAMSQAWTDFANPGTPYQEGRSASVALERAKKQIASALSVRADEIYIASGATESDNMAILGAVRPHIAKAARVVTLETEHKSVLGPVKQLEREGAQVDYARVDSGGVVDLGDLADKIGDSTVLVSVAYASSEIGTIQPLTKVGALIAEIKKSRAGQGNATPLLLHSDCSAAAGLLPLSPTRLGVDLLTLTGSKIYGPHTGVLYVRQGVAQMLQPLTFGGGQQQGLRPGREDVVATIGLARALEIAEDMRADEVGRLTTLRNQLLLGVEQLSPTSLLNGSPTHRLANNLNITIPGHNGEDMVAHFDARGIAIATGAACAAADEAPSHVLLAIGRTADEAQCSLRITLGRQTTAEQIEHFLLVYKQVLTRLATI